MKLAKPIIITVAIIAAIAAIVIVAIRGGITTVYDPVHQNDSIHDPVHNPVNTSTPDN